jgi:hypothetical protein
LEVYGRAPRREHHLLVLLDSPLHRPSTGSRLSGKR